MEYVSAYVAPICDSLLHKIRCTHVTAVVSFEPFRAVNRLIPWTEYSEAWEPLEGECDE